MACRPALGINGSGWAPATHKTCRSRVSPAALFLMQVWPAATASGDCGYRRRRREPLSVVSAARWLSQITHGAPEPRQALAAHRCASPPVHSRGVQQPLPSCRLSRLIGMQNALASYPGQVAKACHVGGIPYKRFRLWRWYSSLTQAAPVRAHPPVVIAERCLGRALRRCSQTAGDSQFLQAERCINFLSHHAARFGLRRLATSRELHRSRGDNGGGFQAQQPNVKQQPGPEVFCHTVLMLEREAANSCRTATSVS